MEIGAIFALRTDAESTKLFAFPLVSQVEGVGELAGIAFFAETSLVVFADEVANAATLFLGDVVPLGTLCSTRTVAFDEVLAERSCNFRGQPE